MIKLTDLELCKKIAEIEGVPIDCIDCIDGEWLGIHGKYDIEEYNPFEWSLLGPLMVKYKVVVSYSFGYVSADYGINRYFYGETSELPRAILECIVETNS